MSRSIEHGGLCSTCKNAADCTFLRDPDKAVVRCEEFDSGEASPTEIAGKDRSPPSLSYAAKSRNSARFYGLCSDCEECEACMFLKPEGGVWHCEEYR